MQRKNSLLHSMYMYNISKIYNCRRTIMNRLKQMGQPKILEKDKITDFEDTTGSVSNRSSIKTKKKTIDERRKKRKDLEEELMVLEKALETSKKNCNQKKKITKDSDYDEASMHRSSTDSINDELTFERIGGSHPRTSRYEKVIPTTTVISEKVIKSKIKNHKIHKRNPKHDFEEQDLEKKQHVLKFGKLPKVEENPSTTQLDSLVKYFNQGIKGDSINKSKDVEQKNNMLFFLTKTHLQMLRDKSMSYKK